ncbi:hypothetical protein J0B03_00915 [Alkalibacter rhizosphaerae]|uniref:Uncharacterized protein n=1 Tax=Alkalibacter rhizosphaerae TaxID=2815577 RepID=A0A974XF25_9FIRM|nr:hypothetical protein [Alkalibacter rhizosphaerae]QSX08682.1 hypothetical protein J0B03_00915 [Alkalibacter rhizosphaerae]
MDNFIVRLSGITTLLNPIMTFLLLLSAVFFLLHMKEQVDKVESYFRSIALSLQRISDRMSDNNNQGG